MTNTNTNTEDATTLFIGNLSEKVTEELLYELFLQVGPLESVKIPNDSKGGKCSFGFIRFKHMCSPDYAINLLQGTSLFSRNINLQRRNKAGSNIRHKAQQQEPNHHKNYNASIMMKHRDNMPDIRHIRFDSEPNFDIPMDMGANLVNMASLQHGGNRDYRGHSDNPNRRFSDNQRSFKDTNRSVNDNNDRGSRSSNNRNRSYQGEYDNRRYNSNDFSPIDNNRRQSDRGYDDRRERSGNKSHKNNRSHDRRPYDSNSRNRGRY